MALTPLLKKSPVGADHLSKLDARLAEFESSWRSGSRPRAEDWIDRLDPLLPAEATELIYHEFCLAESDGRSPRPEDYIARFPAHRETLNRLFELHKLDSPASNAATATPADMPQAGDEIGPYWLARELGRGSFARVFLAEQLDLDRRPVVVKVTTRPSPEPKLLARARHAHIVEVLSHASVDDGLLQIICMPFLGGATLASVNTAAGCRPGRARKGRVLLERLDRAAAPELPAAYPPRPAREIIARASYPRAVAWVFARLAEALHHANTRGVAHGDIKPSNILLTADAVPMLFDFNLAVDRRNTITCSFGGGTLAYMPPERLLALAACRSGEPRDNISLDLHRCDLYALALVLVETLTGIAPEVPSNADGSTGPGEYAAKLAEARAGGVTAFPGWDSLALPSGLRTILARCLAANPADRYVDGRSLAEDLDRWRKDLAPIVASDAPWPARIARFLRRRRLPVAAVLLTLLAAATAAAWTGLTFKSTLHDQAQSQYAGFLDKDDAGLFGFHPIASWTARPGGDPVENAVRKLNRYHVLEDPEWRLRDAVRALDPRDRDDLELLMLEQVYRLASAWAARENSEPDWRRALDLLNRECALVPASTLEDRRREICRRLGVSEVGAVTEAPRVPGWVESYLEGVALEPLHARDALTRFDRASVDRPHLLWPHFRAAAVAFRIREFDQEVRHLREAVTLRPENPSLWTHLASAFHWNGQTTEALGACDRALELDPEFVEAYRSRTFIEIQPGQSNLRKRDSDRYSILTRFQGHALGEKLRLQWLRQSGGDLGEDDPRLEEILSNIRRIDPSDPDVRVIDANRLHDTKRDAEALLLLDAVLLDYPDHLKARYTRGLVLPRNRRIDAIAAIEQVLKDPRIEEFICENPTTIQSFNYVTAEMILYGRLDEAIELAEHGLALALRTNHFPGDLYYGLARARAAAAARGDSGGLDLVRRLLLHAVELDPKLLEIYAKDKIFSELRRVDPTFLMLALQPTAPAEPR
jgi:tetratricopeptide (TPR) repeat protein